jgi:hypothetical protein
VPVDLILLDVTKGVEASSERRPRLSCKGQSRRPNHGWRDPVGHLWPGCASLGADGERCMPSIIRLQFSIMRFICSIMRFICAGSI